MEIKMKKKFNFEVRMKKRKTKERINAFLFRVYNSDNIVSYVPDELALLRYSLRYTKLLIAKDLFGRPL